MISNAAYIPPIDLAVIINISENGRVYQYGRTQQENAQKYGFWIKYHFPPYIPFFREISEKNVNLDENFRPSGKINSYFRR